MAKNKLIEEPKKSGAVDEMELEVADKVDEVALVEAVEEIEKTVKAEKPVEAKKPVEPKVLKFKNVGKGMKIKLVDEDRKKFRWITVKPGEVVSIPRKIALRNRLVEVK